MLLRSNYAGLEAIDNLEDKWFQVAALSASSDDAPRLFDKAVAMGGSETKGRAMLFGYLAERFPVRFITAFINPNTWVALSTRDFGDEISGDY